ncbi:hypothetical protein GGR58DRAFT_504943 [Xylaria digitata]|nr:hypothetical protein GGR58DRAFT_504943 [Xylaria digitata]
MEKCRMKRRLAHQVFVASRDPHVKCRLSIFGSRFTKSGILDICAISIARIALYQLIIEYGQTDFTWSGTTLYIFTSIEALLACTISCLPLLRPVGGQIASSVPISWAMSLVSTFKDKKNTQNSSVLEAMVSSEGSNSSTFMTIGGTPHRQWKRLDDNERKIHVGREFELRRIELKMQTRDLEAQV